MTVILRLVGWLMALAAFTMPAGAESGFRRGVNLGDYLAYPTSEAWPIFRGPRAATTDAELSRLAAAGFDFVRLAVEPSPFLDRSPGEVQALEDRLVDIVQRITAAGMKVMLSGWARHESTTSWRAEQILETRNGEAFERYLSFLQRIVVLLRDVPADRWALEPMNEPQVACLRTSGPDWAEFQRSVYRALRAMAPSLTIVLTPGCWSAIRGLVHLDLTGYDARTLVDLHFYEPHSFTHQGTSWGEDSLKALTGLAFPPSLTDRHAAIDASARLFQARGDKAGAAGFAQTLREIDAYIKDDHGIAHIARRFGEAKAWADREGVAPSRIVIGEFGAWRQPPEAKAADDGSRNRWLETVRKAAEAQGFGWALYAYHSDFGLVLDDLTAKWDDTMLPPLGLRQPPR